MSCQAQDKTENVECRAEGENVSKQITLTSGSECTSATVAIVATPKHGTATLNGGVLTYEPTTNYIGQDYVGYQVSDGNEYSCGIVTLNVGNGQCHVEVERCDGQALDQRTWVDAKVFDNATACKINDICHKQKGGCPSCPTSNGTVESGTPVSGGCDAEECNKSCVYKFESTFICGKGWSDPQLVLTQCETSPTSSEMWILMGNTATIDLVGGPCVDTSDCTDPPDTFPALPSPPPPDHPVDCCKVGVCCYDKDAPLKYHYTNVAIATATSTHPYAHQYDINVIYKFTDCGNMVIDSGTEYLYLYSESSTNSPMTDGYRTVYHNGTWDGYTYNGFTETWEQTDVGDYYTESTSAVFDKVTFQGLANQSCNGGTYQGDSTANDVYYTYDVSWSIIGNCCESNNAGGCQSI